CWSSCASGLYSGVSPGDGARRLMLDVSPLLPGTQIELVRHGTGLLVRLHARDEATRELLDSQRGRLVGELARQAGAEAQAEIQVEVV
ncbi:hypothetical protein OOT46_18020, partial [Aquabacterium sp. A7-Y]|uniref:type III secretion HpaP family protein n=1 Tax=Aquabacterium sp. A7-Y TaxID=1349605 RepID=UPI00223CF59C